MNVLRPRSPRRGARREAGFILVTGMMFLVVMTLLGLALFRSSGLLDRITANTRDKQRSRPDRPGLRDKRPQAAA